jgi:hypothetical protein
MATTYFPNSSQVVIVVLGDKQQMVHKTHLHFQPCVPGATGEIIPLQPQQSLYLPITCCAKALEDVFQVLIVMYKIAVQVSGWSQGLGSSEILVETFSKQIFLVQQMARVLLNRPFSTGSSHQSLPRKLQNGIFQPGGSASKSRKDVRVEINREIEIESPVDPKEACS